MALKSYAYYDDDDGDHMMGIIVVRPTMMMVGAPCIASTYYRNSTVSQLPFILYDHLISFNFIT